MPENYTGQEGKKRSKLEDIAIETIPPKAVKIKWKKKKNEPSLWDNFKQSNLCLRYFGWEKIVKGKCRKEKIFEEVTKFFPNLIKL